MKTQKVPTLFALCLLLSLSQINAQEEQEVEEPNRRQGKFFSIFQVITFPNSPCGGTGTRNGTCYTEQECENRGGSNSGTCASGFGVCCVITVNCGERSSENCTYFESSGIVPGCCEALVCPCSDNICQLRLDFDTFTISGPTTNTNSIAKRRANAGDVTVNANQNIAVTQFGQCLTDSFTVSNPDGPTPPTICGVNSGQHMYVESSSCCNKLSFTLGNNAISTTIPTRSWSIKVTQYSCNYPNLAPQGCTQYFFGSTTTTTQSFNYNNGDGIHLADQDQAICVRRERSNCRICWTVVNNADFALTGSMAASSVRNGNLCCDYGAPTAMTMKGFDCVQIPFALTADSSPIPRVSVFCGNNLGLKGGTTCSTRTPFLIHFRSDHWEASPEASMGGATRNGGFSLVYIMDSIGCNPASITIAAG